MRTGIRQLERYLELTDGGAVEKLAKDLHDAAFEIYLAHKNEQRYKQPHQCHWCNLLRRLTPVLNQPILEVAGCHDDDDENEADDENA